MARYKKIFLFTLLLALFLRLFLAYWSVTYPLDINGDQTRYEDWAQTAHIHGFSKTYEQVYLKTGVINQPPGTLYLLTGTYEVYIEIGKILNKITHTRPGTLVWYNTYFFHAFMRVPDILTDVLMGLILYLLVKKEKGEKWGIISACLIWFNPITLYNSSIWGQTDSIANFFFLLAIYLAYKKKFIVTLLSFAASLYIKLSILPLLPFFLVFLYFYSGRQWKKIILGILLSILAIILATYPISSNPVGWLVNQWPGFSSGEQQYISSAAYNFWWAITCLPNFCLVNLPSSTPFLSISLTIWAYLLFALFALPILYFQIIKNKLFVKKEYLFFALSLVALSVFLFMPRMHDRYLYPFFILFSPAVVLVKKPKRYLILFCVFSVIYFANMVSSWYPARYPSRFYSDIMYGHPFRWLISILILALSVYLYVVCYKRFAKEKVGKNKKDV